MDKLKESVDYVVDPLTGNWVFLASYLRRRGYCCRSLCRNCPFGYFQGPVIVLLGASDNPERVSYQAMHALEKAGHIPVLVNPNLRMIEGRIVQPVLPLNTAIDTLIFYVNQKISSALEKEILKLAVKRVIFNPGTENRGLAQSLKSKGVEVVEECMLVMLRAQQF